jgi:hypothetical protein
MHVAFSNHSEEREHMGLQHWLLHFSSGVVMAGATVKSKPMALMMDDASRLGCVADDGCTMHYTG